jgi:hypothetical protein
MTSFLVQKTTERLAAFALGRREGAYLQENVQRCRIKHRVAYAESKLGVVKKMAMRRYWILLDTSSRGEL